MEVATTLPFNKKSTLLIVPSESLAVAAKEIVAGSRYDAPLAGAVSVTVGDALGCTVTLIGAEVVVALRSSVATAVSDHVPAGMFVHGTLKTGPFDDATKLPLR